MVGVSIFLTECILPEYTWICTICQVQDQIFKTVFQSLAENGDQTLHVSSFSLFSVQPKTTKMQVVGNIVTSLNHLNVTFIMESLFFEFTGRSLTRFYICKKRVVQCSKFLQTGK